MLEIQPSLFRHIFKLRSVAAALRHWLAALVACVLIAGGIAYANQVPTTSAGAAPTVTKTYPSGLNYTATVAGPSVGFFNPSTALNATGGVTSAQLSPSVSATSNAIDMDVFANGCVFSTLRCANRGTLTINFNSAVTNPVIHLSGFGGRAGTTSFFHTSMNLTTWTAIGAAPTLALVTGTSNLQVIGGTEIRSPTINGATTCGGAPPAGCGSVRINGTVTSVTFQLDLLMGGTTNPTASASDGWTFTVSTDEDFGDAPGTYDTTAAASHGVGGLYMGASVTADNVATTNGGTITPSPLASANASSDTDNGVTFPTLIRGVSNGTIDVAVTGVGGRLQGWIDWADDGNHSTAGDRIATDVQDGGAGDTDGAANGVIRLAVTSPVGAALTPTIARFRWSSVAGLGSTGLSRDGEVEDYEITVLPQRADLSLAKIVSNATPSYGQSISYTLTLTSAASPASTATATGITVADVLPVGFAFTSATGTGTYNSGTGVWTAGSLAPGDVATLTINGTVTTTGGTVTNIAQISASSLPDPDSTVNNGVTTEDDYASVAFTVAAVPTLVAPVCAAGGTQQRILNGTFAAGTGPAWTNWTANAPWTGTGLASFSDNVTTGTLTQTGLTGLQFGPGTANGTVIQLSQWWRNANPPVGTTTATLTLSVAGTDYARITTPPSDQTIATIIYLNGATGNLSTITEFVITGWRIELPTTVAASGAILFTATPGGGQSDDFEVDNVTLYTCDQGTLLIDKSSTVLSDPVGAPGGPYHIPGALVRYCILVTNPSTATATTVSITDTLPSTVAFVPGSMRSGISCAAAATVEDDDNSGADESDPVGANIAGALVTASRASLTPGASLALTINAIVN